MIIARTRVWALAAVASFTAARSFNIGLAICAALAMWPIEHAGAADWPLRGSLPPQPTYVRWDGWQFGVEAGWGNFRNDFGNSTSPLVAFILRNTTAESEFAPSTWTTLPSGTTNGPVFGGYLGYNMQWEQLVLGVDFGYKYANIATGANDSIARQFVTSDQFLNTVSIDARSQMKLVDYATFRARAGYAWGQFLPYAMVGIAAGRFNYGTTVTVNYTGTPIPPAPGLPFDITNTASSGKTNAVVAGAVAGLGIDYAVTPGMYLRAEWEYVAFAPVNGSRSNINTGKVGVGAHF
ncbi:MAG: outer membrane beta-barrel protein [Pseudolabrys sp.]